MSFHDYALLGGGRDAEIPTRIRRWSVLIREIVIKKAGPREGGLPHG